MLARRATIRKPRRHPTKRPGATPPKSLGNFGNTLKLTTIQSSASRATTPSATRVSFTCETGTCSIGNNTGLSSEGESRPTALAPNATDTAISPSLAKSSRTDTNCTNRTSIATSGNLNPQRTSLYEAYAILKVSKILFQCERKHWCLLGRGFLTLFWSIKHTQEHVSLQRRSGSSYSRMTHLEGFLNGGAKRMFVRQLNVMKTVILPAA